MWWVSSLTTSVVTLAGGAPGNHHETEGAFSAVAYVEGKQRGCRPSAAPDELVRWSVARLTP